MEAIWHSIESVLSIAIMMLLGVALARLGWFDGQGAELVAALVTKLALPCMVLISITNSFDYDNLLVLFRALILPLVSVVAGYYVGVFFCCLFHIPKGRRSIYKAMFYVSNCLYIGLPLNVALFGEASAIYAFEYYVVNTTALWAVAVYQMAREGASGAAGANTLDIAKKIFFSPLLGLLIAVILIVLGIKLPTVLKTPLQYIGSMTTPLSMIFVGIALSRTKTEDLKMNLEMLAAHLGKFLVGPAAVLLAASFFPAEITQLKVMVIQSATPVAVATPALAAVYGLDVKYAAVLTSVSTLLFMGVVPFYMWFLHMYFGQ